MKFILNFSSLVFYWLSFNFVNCDYFASITGLERLLKIESLSLDFLEGHIQYVEFFNKEMERFLDEVEMEQLKIQNDTNGYFENPINSFKAIRRLTVNWKQMEDFTQKIQSIQGYNESLTYFMEDNFTLPTAEDLNGAARGLARLQRFYKLKSEDMAKGLLANKRFNSTFSASDCFVLGQSLGDSKENFYASEWLIEAMQRLKCEETDWVDKNNYNEDKEKLGVKEGKSYALYPSVSNTHILELLGPSLFNAGNPNLALVLNEKLLALDPNNQIGLANRNLFEQGVKEKRRSRLLETIPGVTKLHQLYAPACRGDLQQTPAEKRNLRCRYVTKNVPYYFLGPMKMEELNVDPPIVFYHQVISDAECNQIIEAAKSSLERSMVGQVENSRITEARTSKGTWLAYKNHSFLQKISKRLEDITGLSMKSAEPLQVANYGIAGHYDPHMDAIEDYEDAKREIGKFPERNRILTALFFINNVTLGGSTAFPILRLAVPPIKNNLLVWYNLHTSGDLDYRTTHAACPVIKGSKWIANAWLHTVGQEFKRPCDPVSDAKKSDVYKDYDIEF